mgnify:CR=1 FL=1
MVKYGYYVPKGDSTYHGEAMTFAEMLDYVRRVKARGRPVPADAPRQVVALEVLDQVAAAKVLSEFAKGNEKHALFQGGHHHKH